MYMTDKAHMMAKSDSIMGPNNIQGIDSTLLLKIGSIDTQMRGGTCTVGTFEAKLVSFAAEVKSPNCSTGSTQNAT